MFIIVPDKFDGLNVIEKNIHTIDFLNLGGVDGFVKLTMPQIVMYSDINILPIVEKVSFTYLIR